MKNLPSITNQINEKIIHKVIKENHGEIFPFFFTFISNWLIRAYSHYKDIDKFLIIIYLIHKQLIFYRKNGLIIDYDTFYKDATIEIDKINISDISKDLKIPKESARRKVIENNIKKLNLKLPDAPDPVGSYVATKVIDIYPLELIILDNP